MESRRRALAGAEVFRRKRLIRGGVGLLLSLSGLALFHVWSRIQVVETGYRIRRLLEEREELKGERSRLKVEVATLRSPARIEKAARDMGLGSPDEGRVAVLPRVGP